MTFLLQIGAVTLATIAVVALAGRLCKRLLPNQVTAYLGTQVLRIMLALIGAILLAMSHLEHRIALIITLGAAYFAAVVLEGFRQVKPEGHA